MCREGVLDGLISMEALAPPTMHCVMTVVKLERGWCYIERGCVERRIRGFVRGCVEW